MFPSTKSTSSACAKANHGAAQFALTEPKPLQLPNFGCQISTSNSGLGSTRGKKVIFFVRPPVIGCTIICWLRAPPVLVRIILTTQVGWNYGLEHIVSTSVRGTRSKTKSHLLLSGPLSLREHSRQQPHRKDYFFPSRRTEFRVRCWGLTSKVR